MPLKEVYEAARQAYAANQAMPHAKDSEQGDEMRKMCGLDAVHEFLGICSTTDSKAVPRIGELGSQSIRGTASLSRRQAARGNGPHLERATG